MTSFVELQKALADHLRDPDNNPPLANIEDRRLEIYRGLIFRNIEGFISGCFPILRSLYDEAAWERLVRDFMRSHQSETPYFLEISEEFLKYLQEEREPDLKDPAFMLELAHYEWVELALDKSQEEFPVSGNQQLTGDLLDNKPAVSPLAWCLSYQYPVHRIGPDFQPQQPPTDPTFLVVYRNREDQVRFMEANAVTVRLINLLSDDAVVSGRQALQQLAIEMQYPSQDAMLDMGAELLAKLQSNDILL